MTYHPRNIDSDLLAWAAAERRKPLVVRGARQTGKTESVRQLGCGFDLLVELNLERHEDRRLVASCDSAQDLLAALALRHDLVRFPKRTLLFLDEIQEDARVVTWLRFLYEDHPELHVVAAGSLMEVRLQDRGFSFPVGRVTFRYLHPFSFHEFLGATGRSRLARGLRDAAQKLQPLTRPVHHQAEAAFREYVLVGGMPEAVTQWSEHRSAVAVRQVHSDLHQAFTEDLHKVRGVRDLVNLEAAFDSLRHHYGQRFKYEHFSPGYRSHQMKTSLDRLEGMMVCRRAWPTSELHPPLRLKPRAAPKLLPLDVGLAASTSGVAVQALQSVPIEQVLDGRIAEAVVGQLLVSAQTRSNDPLHFWVRESSRANAEVDYLVDAAGTLLPVEVKAGAAGSLKSLHQYLWRSGSRIGMRLHGGLWSDDRLEVAMPDGDLQYRLLSLPLFMAEYVPGIVVEPRPRDGGS